MKNANSKLGKAISALRKEAGLSQEDLADRAALHRTYVSQLERGLKSPTVLVLARLAKALKVTPSHILRMIED